MPDTLSEIDELKAKHKRQLQRAKNRETIRGDWEVILPAPIPETLQTPYKLDAEGVARNATLMKKYVERDINIRRAWNRTQRYIPELMRPDVKPQTVLELSTAHGAMLEVARYHGHEIIGNDYANMVVTNDGQKATNFRKINDDTFDRTVDDYGYEIVDDPNKQDWPYRYITEAADIPMKIFDCGACPYPFDDKSVDVTICMQSIEHYCHPDEWMKILDEMCRVTRRSIFILLNRMDNHFKKVDGYEAAYENARMQLRNYNANGFENVACHIHWGRVYGFKLMALGK